MQEFGSAWDWLPKTLVDWAQVLSAIGTCGAVIVSLWLATRKPAPMLKVNVGVRLMPPPIKLYKGALREDFLLVVENIADTPAVVEGLQWRMRKRWSSAFERDEHVVERMPAETGGWSAMDAPKLLRQGERIQVERQLRGDHGWCSRVAQGNFFADHLKSRSDCDRLRLVVSTSVGKPLVVRPTGQLLDAIWDAVPRAPV